MSIIIDMINCCDLDCAYNVHHKCTSELHDITPQNLFGQNLKCNKKISININSFAFNESGEINAK